MAGYLILTLGGLLFGAMVYRYDMHEREPWWMLVLAVIAGGLTMFLAFTLEDLLQSVLIDSGPQLNYRVTKSVMAGTIEELAKLAIPVGVLLLVKKHFNDPMDGLIYGSLAGLGAALYESVWYSFFIHAHTQPGLLQEQGSNAMRLMLHTLWGGIGGYALGLVVMKKPWRTPMAKCVGLVMLMHFLWDAVIGFANDQGFWQRLVAAGLLSASIIWYGILVIRTNKWSREMHAPKSKKRLVGRIVRALITRRIR